MSSKTRYRVLIAGGGTGGHLFPAIAVAEKIKEMKPETEILFIGTKSKIEGTVVPKLGYKFIFEKIQSRKYLFPCKTICFIDSIDHHKYEVYTQSCDRFRRICFRTSYLGLICLGS